MGSGFDRVRREADAMWPEAVRQLSGARCEEQTKKPGRERPVTAGSMPVEGTVQSPSLLFGAD